ncbi:hypothetical protein FVA95_26685 [Pseudonocardia sp. EV170527-09]|uniref:hypothetical protein n=1 Tax=Pseudonocardia sp. EV170527-09 TaxID=2603411 RepID=UPI0011F2883A|nr:hypothetical protein [Pseudonocardia sp. EV170527-09]KAA1013929.1 hypothetical protein FVA95_26685 [Pseudonocardia sp. EV170527-09]
MSMERMVPLGYRLFDEAHEPQVAARAVRVVAANAHGLEDLHWLCDALGLEPALSRLTASTTETASTASTASRGRDPGARRSSAGPVR